MAIDAIAAQPITNRQLVNYIRPGESGADQASLRSLLAAAGFPAAEGADALTSQVRRFQQAETAAGRPFVHGADGKAGPETLGRLRGIVQSNLQQAEVPTSLADDQAQRFVTSPQTIARTPTAQQVATPPGPGQARVAPGAREVAGGDRTARQALDQALAQRQAAEREPMTPGEAQREAAAEAARRQPTTGDQIRSAATGRARLAQISQELSRLQGSVADPMGAPLPGADDNLRQIARLQREQQGLTAQLQQNPQNARFDDLERAQRELQETRTRVGRAGARTGRTSPEGQRAIDERQARVTALAAELGYLP